MNSVKGSLGSVCSTVLLLLSLGSPALVGAQQEMSVEELEKYIAEQKAALELVRSELDATENKVEQAREALEEQNGRKARVESELDALCKEQDALKPGSYDNCKAQSHN